MISYQLTSTVEQLHSINFYYDQDYRTAVIVFQNYQYNKDPGVINLDIRNLSFLKKQLQSFNDDITCIRTVIGNDPNQCFLLSRDLTLGTTFIVYDSTRVEKTYSFTDNQIKLIIGFITDILENDQTNFITKI